MSRQILSDIIKEFSPTVEEVAEALKLHPYTIRRLCREGKIPAFSAILYGGSASGEKFGGQWRFDKQELDNLRKRKNKKGI
ncbi:MAG TPA: DNA-binding protein [Candidatus Omnitrophica bacterium]|nr:DNA-binding protein [Candidatus Omnitrophota bacterium]